MTTNPFLYKKKVSPYNLQGKILPGMAPSFAPRTARGDFGYENGRNHPWFLNLSFVKKQLSTFSLPILLLLLPMFFLSTGCPKKKIAKPGETITDSTSFDVPLKPVPQETITDSTSFDVPLKPVPQRIISLAPEMTDLIKALKSEKRLVGKTSYCDSSIKAELVGSLLQPNIEKIISLKPDLIVASKEGNSSKEILSLRDRGFRVFIGSTKRNYTDIRLGFLLLARLLDRENLGKKMIADLEQRLHLVERRIKKRPGPSVFIEIWPKPLTTAGGGTFHQSMMDLSGGKNIAEDLRRYPQFSVEEVLSQDPQVILILQNSPGDGGRPQFWKKFSPLQAVQKKRIHLLSASLSLPTPENFVRGVEKMARIFHPEAFK